MPELPKELVVTTMAGELSLTKSSEEKVISGISEKSIYQSSSKDLYYVKLPKERSINTFFKNSLSTRIEKVVEKAQEKLSHHKTEIQHNNSFLEILCPRVGELLFDKLLTAPVNYIMITDGNIPLVLSKALPNFDEFLSHTEIAKNKKTPADWNKKLPSRSELNLSTEQAKILGNLYCIGLIMGHYDLFNNINLTNSGSFKTADGKLIAAIVDWGNTMGVGFSGLTSDENAFFNLDIQTGKIDNKNLSIEGFQHCMPFDEEIYPLLPRQIIQDLFEMSTTDELGKATLAGFKEACDAAQNSLTHLETSLPATIQTTLEQYTHKDHVEYIKRILNKDFYFPEKNDGNKYTLLNVLKGRILSTKKMLTRLENGETIDTIAQNTLEKTIKSQSLFSKNKSQEKKETPSQESTPLLSPLTIPNTPPSNLLSPSIASSLNSSRSVSPLTTSFFSNTPPEQDRLLESIISPSSKTHNPSHQK